MPTLRSLLLLSLALASSSFLGLGLGGCASADAADGEEAVASDDELRGQLGLDSFYGVYFAVEGVAPCNAATCASYRLALVNREASVGMKVTCPDGTRATECTVTSIDLAGLKLSASNLALAQHLLVTSSESSVKSPRLLLGVANQSFAPVAEGVQAAFVPRDLWVADKAKGSAGFPYPGSRWNDFQRVPGGCAKPSPFAGAVSYTVTQVNTGYSRYGSHNVNQSFSAPPELYTAKVRADMCAESGPGLIVLGDLRLGLSDGPQSISATNIFTKLR